VLDKLASADFAPYLNQAFHMRLDEIGPIDLEPIGVTEAGSVSRPEASRRCYKAALT